jgi:hypothetical protein
MTPSELKDANLRLSSVVSRLSKQAWFKKGKWLTDVHPFPTQKPDGITLHVYKEHWFNDDHRGVHIESYLDLNPKRQTKSYVTLHIFHTPYIPGTKIKRIEVSKPFVDLIYEDVSKWQGYKFRTGKYGQQPFSKKLDGTSANFEDLLFQSIQQICQKLGPPMDQILERFR